mgnify:CR=1 FL=1
MIDYVYGHITPDYSADEMAKLRIVPDKASSPAMVSSPLGTEAGALRDTETELAQKDVGISLEKAV